MGTLYADEGDDDKALTVLKKVLKIAPDDGVALYNCAC
ncbi:hypothetical protein GWO43_28030, partial [candidate division KSB1 bacterium]|nr:hypothetical protein [candidate division KSB1 bacterium]NIV69437.1 hypothetical protein [Phycisphaerae bacterium]NIR70735.1 hypothetical protein [candidate division KSB1 bacterium]NIS27792.1 hypothetical protein [candidate division KSB1 bacterium]NIT74640.1 hypothetical protein [candidate division KSB1 bacterium]